MAVSVTANLTNIFDGSSATNWTSGRGVSVSTEVFIQGTNALAGIVAKNTNDTWDYDYYADNGNTNLNVSATDTHIYFWMKCDIAPFIDYIRLGLRSDTARGAATTGDYNWIVVDNTVNIEWGGEWRCFVVDINATASTSTGTLDLSACDDIYFVVDNSNSGNIRSIENTYIDVCRHGTGLTMTGTAWDMTDVAADDNLVANKYGILQNINGVLFSQGRLTVGSGATTTTPASANEDVVFVDPSTQGQQGGALGSVSSTLYQLNFTGSGLSGTFANTSFKSAGATDNSRFVFDASDTNITSLTFDAGTIQRAGLVSFAAGLSATNLNFVNCFQITPSSATFTGNTISDYVGTEGGALLWNGGTTTNSCTFVNCDEGVEITQTTNQTFQSLIFDDAVGNFDVHLNNGGTSIEVAKTGTPAANPNSYTATGGGVVTFTASYDHVLTNLELNTEVTYVKVSDGSVLFHVENATTADGGGKYKTTYTHGGIDTVNVLIHHISYQPDISNIYNLVLPASDTSVKIQMFPDLNYENP